MWGVKKIDFQSHFTPPSTSSACWNARTGLQVYRSANLQVYSPTDLYIYRSTSLKYLSTSLVPRFRGTAEPRSSVPLSWKHPLYPTADPSSWLAKCCSLDCSPLLQTWKSSCLPTLPFPCQILVHAKGVLSLVSSMPACLCTQELNLPPLKCEENSGF
jgi:hypothetical protein